MRCVDSLPQQTEVEGRIQLLNAAARGQLHGLTCPRCSEAKVEVWFTNPAPHEYRTWFLCEQCGFEMRAQNDGMPPFYTPKRDRTAGGPVPALSTNGPEHRS